MNPYLETLKKNGLKITPLREVILEVFQKKRATLTVEKLCQLIRRRIPRAGLQSVYRNLSDFTKAGIVEEIFIEKRKAAYALCHGFAVHHHHAVCTRCGRSEEIEACELGFVAHTLSRAFRNLKKKLGFQVKHHVLQLEGFCRACQR
ncbi:MAG: transcriptional repressor [Candidatus Omnitrophica bacterium]|nr:transcriptional repressor [Candidatus Omnitrophota bacterium]